MSTLGLLSTSLVAVFTLPCSQTVNNSKETRQRAGALNEIPHSHQRYSQVLFLVSTLGLLSTSLVAVLAVASPALRNASFLLFVLFCNGVPFIYELTVKMGSGRMWEDVPKEYLYYWVRLS